MNQKENLSPLTSMPNNGNAAIDIKGKESLHVTKQQKVGLKQLDAKKNNTKDKKTTTTPKKNFLDANNSPSTKPPTTTTTKPLVFKDTQVEQPRRSASPIDTPLLLLKEEHVHIHHKKVKPLSLPKTNDTKEDEEEIKRLEQRLKEVQDKRDKKLSTLNEIKQKIKKANEAIKSNKQEIKVCQDMEAEIATVLEEREEQQSMLAELLDMMSEFSQGFKDRLAGHNERMALKEEQIQQLLNTLSELNYRLQE